MVETGKGPLRKPINYQAIESDLWPPAGHQLSSCLIPVLRGRVRTPRLPQRILIRYILLVLENFLDVSQTRNHHSSKPPFLTVAH